MLFYRDEITFAIHNFERRNGENMMNQRECKNMTLVLESNRQTSGYIVREKTKKHKVKIETRKRAAKFKEKISETTDCKMLINVEERQKRVQQRNTKKER